jgi:hypothetical protein
MDSSTFSYGMPNFTLQFSNSIPAIGPNSSIGLGGNTPLYTPFSFGGSQIPQMTPNMRGMLAFNPRPNPPTSRWNSQPSGQVSTQVPSYNPTSSAQIPTNKFGMLCLYPPNSSLGEVSFTLWATPNLDLIQLGVVSITLNRTFQLE